MSPPPAATLASSIWRLAASSILTRIASACFANGVPLETVAASLAILIAAAHSCFSILTLASRN